MKIIAAITAAALCGAICSARPAISSGTPWHDANGDVIQAHGGSLTKVGSTYYWVGENRDGLTPIQASMAGFMTWPFKAITCYASKDLVRWRKVGKLLAVQKTGDLGPDRIVERPKILYSRPLRKYVLYVHLDDYAYKEARVGVATSDTVCGRYQLRTSFKPLGRDSRDLTLFEDVDGQAYLVSASDRNSTLRIVRLSEDRLGPAAAVTTIDSPLESPAILRRGKTYFLLASKVTGWASNDNVYYTAPAISGPWTLGGDFTPQSPDTYDTQVSFVFPVSGSRGTTYLFMGDRWFASGGTSLGSSRYIWLPLTVAQTTVELPYLQSWTPDTARGTYNVGTSAVNCVSRDVAGC